VIKQAEKEHLSAEVLTKRSSTASRHCGFRDRPARLRL